MDTPMLLEILAGAGGGLATGVVLGWWYFRRGAAHGPAGDADEAADEPIGAAEVARLEALLADLERVHAGCATRLRERERLIAVLREQAAGAAARLSDMCDPAHRP
jgi:hypothetical protein